MKRKACCALILGVVLFPGIGMGAEPFPGVEKLMTPEQLKSTGLEKLTPEELKFLNEWLRNYSAGTAETAKVEAKAAAKAEARAEVVKEVREQEKDAKQAERIVSQIQGEFRGWNGKTMFPLKNGQVWQQRSSGQLFHKAVEPKVEITKNLLGYYVMHIIGTSYSVGVKRVN